MKNVYVTIEQLDEYGNREFLRPGQRVKLVKDRDHAYDDEAIKVMTMRDVVIGYAANSADTAARGTYSAGRLYDTFGEECCGVIRFITQSEAIAEIIEGE